MTIKSNIITIKVTAPTTTKYECKLFRTPQGIYYRACVPSNTGWSTKQECEAHCINETQPQYPIYEY